MSAVAQMGELAGVVGPSLVVVVAEELGSGRGHPGCEERSELDQASCAPVPVSERVDEYEVHVGGDGLEKREWNLPCERRRLEVAVQARA
jgi:hypothetical protein